MQDEPVVSPDIGTKPEVPNLRFRYLNEFLNILAGGVPQTDNSGASERDTDTESQVALEINGDTFLGVLERSLGGYSSLSTSIPEGILNFTIAFFHLIALISKHLFHRSLLPVNLIKELVKNIAIDKDYIGILNEVFKHKNLENIFSNIISILLKPDATGNNELSVLFVKIFKPMGSNAPEDPTKTLAAYYLNKKFESLFGAFFNKENIDLILEITRLFLKTPEETNAEESSKALMLKISALLKKSAPELSEILIDHIMPLLMAEIRAVFYEDPKNLSGIEKYLLEKLNEFGIDKTKFKALDGVITEALKKPTVLKDLIVCLLKGDMQGAINSILQLDSVILLASNSLPLFMPIIKPLIEKKYPIFGDILERFGSVLTPEKFHNYINALRNFYFATKLRDEAIKTIVDAIGATGKIAEKLQAELGKLSDEQLLLMTTENPDQKTEREKEIDKFLLLEAVKEDIASSLPQLKNQLMSAKVNIKENLDNAVYRQKLFILNIAELLNDPDLKVLVISHILPKISKILKSYDVLTEDEWAIKQMLIDKGINADNFEVLSELLPKILEKSGSFEKLIGYFFVGDMQGFYSGILELVPAISSTVATIPAALPLFMPIIKASVGTKYPIFIEVLEPLFNDKEFQSKLTALLTPEKLQQFINIAQGFDAVTKLRKEARSEVIEAILNIVSVGDVSKEIVGKLKKELSKLPDGQLLAMTAQDPEQRESRKQEIDKFLSSKKILAINKQMPELTSANLLKVQVNIKEKLDKASIIQKLVILDVAELLHDPDLKNLVIRHILPIVEAILANDESNLSKDERAIKKMLTDKGINLSNFKFSREVIIAVLKESGSFEELIGNFFDGNMDKVFDGMLKLGPSISSISISISANLPLFMPIVEASVGKFYPNFVKVLGELLGDSNFQAKLQQILTPEKIGEYIKIAREFDAAIKSRTTVIENIVNILDINAEEAKKLKVELEKLSDAQLLEIITQVQKEQVTRIKAIDNLQGISKATKGKLKTVKFNEKKIIEDLDLAADEQLKVILKAASLFKDPNLVGLITNHILPKFLEILATSDQDLSFKEIKIKKMLKGYGINDEMCEMIGKYLSEVKDLKKDELDLLEIFNTIAESPEERKIVRQLNQCIQKISKSDKSLDATENKGNIKELFDIIGKLVGSPKVQDFLNKPQNRERFLLILDRVLPVAMEGMLDKYKRCVADRFLMELEEIIEKKQPGFKIPPEVFAAFIKSQDLNILIKWADNKIEIPLITRERFKLELAATEIAIKKLAKESSDALSPFLSRGLDALVKHPTMVKDIIDTIGTVASAQSRYSLFSGAIRGAVSVGFDAVSGGVATEMIQVVRGGKEVYSKLMQGTNDLFADYEDKRSELELLNEQYSSFATDVAKKPELLKAIQCKQTELDILGKNLIQTTKTELIGKAADYVCRTVLKRKHVTVDKNGLIAKMQKFSLAELKDMFTTDKGVYDKGKINPQNTFIASECVLVAKQVKPQVRVAATGGMH